jgi:PAS domain S-box-containing protein
LKAEKKKNQNIDFNIEDLILILVRIDEMIEEINQKGCELLEYSRADVLHKNFFDTFVPLNNREEMRTYFHQFLKGLDRRGRLESKILDNTGKERMISWNNLILRDEKDQVSGALFLGQDVTRRKQMEERYIRLASFPSFSPNPVIEVDFNRKITYTNPATKKVIPHLERQDIYKSFFSDWDRILAAFKGKISIDYSFGREIKVGEHWYLQQFSFIPIGPRIRIIAINVDEKKKAEEKLKLSEEKYRSLFENMINGYAYCRMIFDNEDQPVDFAYLEVNAAFEKITGLKREEVLGRRVSEAIPGTREANPEIFEKYGRVARTGKTESFEIFFKPLRIWFNISVYRPKQDHFVAIFENITKRKELEQELNSYNQRLEEVVAQRTTEYAQANKILTQEIVEHHKTEEGLQFRAMVLDNLSIAIFLANLRGEFVYVNSAACELFGYSCSELMNMNLMSALHIPEVKNGDILERLQKTEQIDIHTVHTKENMEKTPIHLHMNLMKSAHGKLIISVIHKVEGLH